MEVERCSFTPCATARQPLPNGLCPSAASRHWLCRFPVTGERHFCYGGAAFGLLRQKYRPPVTENPLTPCRNRAVGTGRNTLVQPHCQQGANGFSTHRLIPSYTHYSIFFFILQIKIKDTYVGYIWLWKVCIVFQSKIWSVSYPRFARGYSRFYPQPVFWAKCLFIKVGWRHGV